MTDTYKDLHERADHLRRIHDYDGAISAYENLVAQQPEDAAARWGLVLCRYGIEYTRDTRTGEEVPGINRMSLDSILEDRDYLLALQYADEAQAQEYRDKARRIAAIQDQLAQIVRREKPYDVFISFKSSDDRRRTRDFTLAQEIYETLTADGFRVFFSPVTLRQHPGEAYEPYIFAALYSARVMVLVGTKKEYLEAEWVRNEWSRYLFMMRQDRKKHLLPVYEGMKPEDFPAGIGRTQGVDLSAIGAMKTVSARVRDLAGEKEKILYVRGREGETVNLTNLMRRILFDVEDGAFEEAERRIAGFAETYGEDYADLRYARLLCRNRCRGAEELARRFGEALTADPDYQYVLENGSEEQKQALQSLETLRDRRQAQAEIEKAIRAARAAYENGRYAEVISGIDRLRNDPAFDREAEVDQLYAMARERQGGVDRRLEFLRLTESGNYLREKFREKSPELYEKLVYVEDAQLFQKEKGRQWMQTALAAVCAVSILAYFFLREAAETGIARVCFGIAVILSLRYFLRNRYPDDDLTENLKNLIVSVLKGFFLTFAPPLAVDVLLMMLHSNAADRDHTILAAIGRFWYGETGTAEAATYVVLFMLILMGTLLINLPGAVEEANRRKQNASVKAKLATAAEYTKELQPIVKAFEKEQREALRQEYGEYLQPLDISSLKSVSKDL